MVFETPRGDACRDAASPDLFRKIVDGISSAIMICDPATFQIVYVNEASKRALSRVQHVLPVPAERVPGSCFDMFCEDPSLRRLLSDPRNLPHEAAIPLGGQRFEFRAAAIHDECGRCVALTVTWRMRPCHVRRPDSASNVVELVRSTQGDIDMSPDAGPVDEDAGAAGEVTGLSDEMLDRLAVTGDKLRLLTVIVREIVARSNSLMSNAMIGERDASTHGKNRNIAVARDASGDSGEMAEDRSTPANELSEQVEKLQRQLRNIRNIRKSLGAGD